MDGRESLINEVKNLLLNHSPKIFKFRLIELSSNGSQEVLQENEIKGVSEDLTIEIINNPNQITN